MYSTPCSSSALHMYVLIYKYIGTYTSRVEYSTLHVSYYSVYMQPFIYLHDLPKLCISEVALKYYMYVPILYYTLHTYRYTE